MSFRLKFIRQMLWPVCLIAALGAPPAPAVERDAAEEAIEEYARTPTLTSKPGFESESKLKDDPSGKSFFFLSNDVQWPERKELVIPAKPPAPPKVPKEPKKRPVKPVEVEADVEVDMEAALPADFDDSTAAAKADKKSPGKTQTAKSPSPAAAAEATKPKPPKKPAVALPDIEQLLADVRRSAQPRFSSDLPAPAARENPAEPRHVASEVESSVDMDALGNDLEKLQKDNAELSKKADESEPAQLGFSGWVIPAAATAGAALICLVVLLIRRRKTGAPRIRSQSQIDAETRAYFGKLLVEQRKRASHQKAKPEAEEVPEIVVPEIPPAAEIEQEEQPHVYLLPPELAGGEYKEVIRLAAEGDQPELIAEKLNMGEGEVRLVLDIARLSRERMQAA